MSKGVIWFPHDFNARNDEKIIAIRMRHHAEGYGIYFMIIEKLLEATDNMCTKDYNNIAFDLRVPAEKVKSIIEDFGLFNFTEDNKYFYSESLKNRMTPLVNLKNQRSEAGKKSAEKRKNNDRCENIQRPLTEKATQDITRQDITKHNIKEIYKENFDFDFCENPEFKNLLLKWMDYKKIIKSELTSQIEIECAYKDLYSLSAGNIKTAEEILAYSINGKCKNFYKREKNENQNQRHSKLHDLQSTNDRLNQLIDEKYGRD